MALKGWQRAFDDPIPCPTALDHAAGCGGITKLPKAEHDAPEWQAAMEALLLVAEVGRPDDVRQDRRHAGPSNLDGSS